MNNVLSSTIDNCYRNSNTNEQSLDLMLKYYIMFDTSREWIYNRSTILREYLSLVPKITAYHPPTKLTCHISFTDGFVVENSKLIKYFLTLQSEALKLSKAIITWSDLSFDEYFMPKKVLLMLIIFFLQTENFLPSTKQIQDNYGRVDIIGGEHENK